MIAGIEHRRLISFDGTEIAYQVRGSGPPVVMANGLGGRFQAFRHIYAELGDSYRTLCWDYRGLFDSGRPANWDAIRVPDHCEDLARILDQERVDRALLIGWSMGVQINFEFCRRWPERVAGIVAINGTYGLPFRTAMSSRVVRYVIPSLLKAIGRNAALVGHASRRVVAWEGLLTTLVRLGMLSHRVDEEVFRAVADGFGRLDWKLYTDMMAKLGEHDARAVLPRIRVPVLVITGDRDIMTPAFTAETIHREVSGSRLVIIEGGTHYTPLEYPVVIQDALRDFLDTVPGYDSTTTADDMDAVPQGGGQGVQMVDATR